MGLCKHHNYNDDHFGVHNHQVVTFYYERLVDLALAQFEWTGLPDTVDRRYLEKTLLANGSVAMYRPQGTEFYVATSWVHDSGMFDMYGYPTGVRGVDYNGHQIETDDFTIVYDNQSRSPLLPKMRMYARLLAQVHLTSRQNMTRQNTPYIVTSSKQENLSVTNIFRRIFTFDPVIEVKDTMNLEDRIQKVDLDVPFKGGELMDYRKRLWDDALSILGIASETSKKERLLNSEVSLNREEDTVSRTSRIIGRQELCDWANERGMNISVNTRVDYSADHGAVPEPDAADSEE